MPVPRNQHHQGRPKGVGGPRVFWFLVLGVKGALHCTNSSAKGGRRHHSFACCFHRQAGRCRTAASSGQGVQRTNPTALGGAALHAKLNPTKSTAVASCGRSALHTARAQQQHTGS